MVAKVSFFLFGEGNAVGETFLWQVFRGDAMGLPESIYSLHRVAETGLDTGGGFREVRRWFFCFSKMFIEESVEAA